MLKVSLKNLSVSKLQFFKNTAFSKMALKIYQKLKNLIFFWIHGKHFYMGFQWYIECFDTFSIPWEIEAFTSVKFHLPPTVVDLTIWKSENLFLYLVIIRILAQLEITCDLGIKNIVFPIQFEMPLMNRRFIDLIEFY